MAIMSAFQAEDKGSIPFCRSRFITWSSKGRTQRSERCNEGSNPSRVARFYGAVAELARAVGLNPIKRCGFESHQPYQLL